MKAEEAGADRDAAGRDCTYRGFGPVLRSGSRVADFDLADKIGSGSLGELFKAHQDSPRRRVALRVLSPELSSDSHTLARFRQRLAVTARCDHPNLVKILCAGEDSGCQFVALEYVEGTSLAAIYAALSPP
ncbi:protein kinase, partial [Planctomycetota bacterium]